MKNILSIIITSENYTAVIAASFILVLILFSVIKLMKKKNRMISVIAVCFMAIAAGTCVSSIAMSIPYMQSDLDAYTAEYTDSLIGDYSIDSSMVELNIPVQ